MKFSRLFLPHPGTHEKAHLLSIKAFVVYFLLFFLIEIAVRGLTPIDLIKPDVLGIESLSVSDLIAQTNNERSKQGLPPLQEDARLNAAAQAKAQNMFEENYWAHYSPSGKDPWGFIQGAGYQFSYAGENLARNFETAPEVVAAWMASPTHRDNIVNNKYSNVGMAVAEGMINGQKTILVVQEFGKPSQSMLAALPNNDKPSPTSISKIEPEIQPQADTTPQNIVDQPIRVAGSETKASILQMGPISISRSIGLSIVGLLVILIVLDLYILRRRMVHRISARHLPHLALLSVAGSVLWNTGGQITQQAVMMVVGN